jgi:hypothetical protein
MRTTLTLDDDVFAAAARRAQTLRRSLGKAVSDLARRGMQSSLPVKEVHGLTVFNPAKGSPKITAKSVRAALHDHP